MSLGMQASGFSLKLANELSPMASETFAFNHLNTDLKLAAQNGSEIPSNVLWLTSNFDRKDLKSRLRENPQEFPDWTPDAISDISSAEPFESKSLVVGSIVTLNNYLSERYNAAPQDAPNLEVDLVSGGPPCQSFSMAGLRQRNNARNTLPWEFAKFVSLTKPKIALLENVSGILRAFNEDGVTYHAWKEVAKAFASIGYAPLCLHVNAKYVGVAQNRPRFLMFAIRADLARKLGQTVLNKHERKIVSQSISAIEENFNWNDFKYWDITAKNDSGLFEETLFRSLNTNPTSDTWVSAHKAIDDLRTSGGSPKSSYVEKLNSNFGEPSKGPEIANHEFRKHGRRVMQRFRLLQVISEISDREVAQSISSYLKKGSALDFTRIVEALKPFEFLFQEGLPLRKAASNEELLLLLGDLTTKKHSQRALVSNLPAPAALSIPDDCCHYAPNQLRTLSVREMARLQSFPDSFEVRSKVTTGGTSRRYEVPQYTQIGNAVPPLLAKQAGAVAKAILDQAEQAD